MEKQSLVVNRIGLFIILLLLASITVLLYLNALNNRYMMIDDLFILDKWTKMIYLNKGENKISKIKSQPKKTLDAEEFLKQLKLK